MKTSLSKNQDIKKEKNYIDIEIVKTNCTCSTVHDAYHCTKNCNL